MANLSLDEMNDLVSLKEYRGYQLLLDALQSEVDNLANELETSAGTAEKHNLYLWKALRRVLYILKKYPEAVNEQLQEFRKQSNISELSVQLTDEQYKKLKDYLDKKKKVL